MPLSGSGVESKVSGTLCQSLRQRWRSFLAEGIILIVPGVAAALLPFLAGLATMILALSDKREPIFKVLVIASIMSPVDAIHPGQLIGVC